MLRNRISFRKPWSFPDQRVFVEEELRQCQEQQKEYAKTDVLTNKAKKYL